MFTMEVKQQHNIHMEKFDFIKSVIHSQIIQFSVKSYFPVEKLQKIVKLNPFAFCNHVKDTDRPFYQHYHYHLCHICDALIQYLSCL